MRGASGPGGWTGLTGEHLARNATINLGGFLVPLLAGVVAIPLLIQALGTSRFGVLALAWTLVGYFSLFDFGLGRALTKLVAERIGTSREPEVARLIWTALATMVVFGAIGGAVGSGLAPWFATTALRIPPELQAETTAVVRWLALSLPIVITSAALRGVLEALHRFGWVNAVRIPMGVLTFAGPLAVVPFSSSLVPIVVVLVGVRLAAWVAHLMCCVHILPWVFRRVEIDAPTVRLLLGFGGWMTVTNIVGPLMMYMDRFLIGAVVSAAAVAYYATPYEVITKVWLLPGALLGVLFPAFAAGLHQDPERVRRIFIRATELLLLILFPVVLVCVLFAAEALALWISAEFASQSAPVARWLAVGVLINSLAMVPFTLIQGAGRPDLTAKLHLLELPPYLLALWWLTAARGVEGAAMAWTARSAVDALLLFVLVRRFLPRGEEVVRRTLLVSLAPAVALLPAAIPIPFVLKVVYAAAMLTVAAMVGWRTVRWPSAGTAPLGLGSPR